MIVVYGASGFTGSMVSRSLLEQGLEVVMAGRDRIRVEEAAEALGCQHVRSAAIHDSEGLVNCFAEADVVINCAGPFGPIGAEVIRAALRADCHYLDTTGEQQFVKRIYEHFESKARNAKRVIVNACAFEVALGDWCAASAAAALEVPIADSIDVYYAVDNLQPTRGTRLSILEALGKPGYMWDCDRWAPAAPGRETRDLLFPEPFGLRSVLSFPSPEVITIPRHSPTHRVQSFVSLGQDTAWTRAASTIAPVVAPVMTPLLGSILRSTLGVIAESNIRSAEVTPHDSAETRFAIVAEARSGDRVSRCSVAGSDIYRVSASIACLAAERLENEGELCGVLTPAQLFDASDALAEIADQDELELELP